MDTASNSAAHLSPYGRACLSCARAKTKCIIGSDVVSRCERCTRLNKDCQPPSAPTRKRKSPGRTSPTESARLERKLDGLYSLLTSKNATDNRAVQSEIASTSEDGNPSSGPPHPHSSSWPNAGVQCLGDSPNPTEATHPRIQTLTPATSNEVISTPATPSGVAPAPPAGVQNLLASTNDPSPHEAQDLLNFFRDEMLVFFPFMTLPPTESAPELRQKYPFLWLCIMAITSKSSSQQTALGHAVRSNLGRLMLVEGEKNLDLLYGIITCLAWGQYYIANKPILSNLVHLSTALLADLGLNRASFKHMPHLLLEFAARGCPEQYCQKQERTLKDRRLVVACFLTTSIISNYFSKVEPFPWTSYLEECLETLARSQENTGDAFLACFARLQVIENNAYQIQGLERVRWEFHLRASQANLKVFKEQIPSHLRNNQFLLLCVHSVTAKIHEISLFPTENLQSLDPHRIESLYTTLEATKSWFDIYFTFPPAHYVRFIIAVSTQLASSLITLYRLTTFEHHGWDRELVRQTCCLTDILITVTEKMSLVKSAAGLDYDDDSSHMKLFEVNFRKLTSIKTWWQARESAKIPSPPTVPATAPFHNQTMGETWLNDMLMMENFRFEPDDFSIGGSAYPLPSFGL